MPKEVLISHQSAETPDSALAIKELPQNKYISVGQKCIVQTPLRAAQIYDLTWRGANPKTRCLCLRYVVFSQGNSPAEKDVKVQ